MDAKPAINYFDRACESHDQFEQIKAELEGQGFKYMGNSTTDERLYSQRINMENDRGLHDVRMAQARREQRFANDVEERTWDFQNSGYQVVRTQGFKVDGTRLDDLVAFFVKPTPQE